jgi:hypothetical protein
VCTFTHILNAYTHTYNRAECDQEERKKCEYEAALYRGFPNTGALIDELKQMRKKVREEEMAREEAEEGLGDTLVRFGGHVCACYVCIYMYVYVYV